jgi:MFS family permease
MATAIPKRLSFARALKSRPFASVWAGQTISNLGDMIFFTALAWQVLIMTGSATAMGVVLVAASIPRLIFMLIGGVVADRLPRRMIVLWSDGGRGIIILLIAILGWMHLLQFWHLVIQSFLFGLVDGFFNPAILAITPELVEKDDLASANSLNSLSQTVSQLLGPALGAILIALISTSGAFAADALSFFLSAAFLIVGRIPNRSPELPARRDQPDETISEERGVEKRRGLKSLVADITEGLAYVKSSRWIWVSIVVLSFTNIGLTVPFVAMPRLVHDVYGQGVWLLSLINSVSAIGSILGLVLVAQASKLKRRGLLAYISILVSSMGIIMFGLPFPRAAAPLIAPIASALVGFGIACYNTIWYTVLQEMIPGDKLGRVISIDSLGSFAMIPVAEAFGGVATDHIGPALVCVLGGLLNIVLILAALLVREIRKLE